MRRLHEEKLRVARKMPDRFAQERSERHVIGVEHDDDRRQGVRQSVVQVSGFGVLVARPGQVVRAELRA